MAEANLSSDAGSPRLILEAARDLFAARGFEGVSARDIAERAGVTKALVFYHYGSKAKLFERILDDYYAAHAAALAQTPATLEGDRQARVHALLDTYLDFIEDNYEMLLLVQREVAQQSQWLAPITRGMAELYERFVASVGDALPGSGPLRVQQFFVSFQGLVTSYFVYAPALTQLWQDDPMSAANRRTRREHLHWMVDTILGRIAQEP